MKTKQDYIKEFGGTRALAEELGISVQAIYQWPDTLSRAIADRIEFALLKRSKTCSSVVQDTASASL
jgi:hypothetical protein